MNACQQLHDAFSRLKRQGPAYQPEDIPANGIYVVFEKGEKAHGTDRIVRVGTHTGQDNLAGRLNEHLFTPNKDRSIFRKHVGRCLLASRDDPFLPFWNICLTKRADKEKYGSLVDRKQLAYVEQQVSAYITSNLTFSVIAVADKPMRLHLEKTLIATIASCPHCHPSSQWLGRHHPDDVIRHGGLWNIQGVKGRGFSEAEVAEFLVEYLA